MRRPEGPVATRDTGVELTVPLMDGNGDEMAGTVALFEDMDPSD